MTSWHHNGLPTAGLTFSGLHSHVFDAEGTQHVFYSGHDDHIVELWWPRGGSAQSGDLKSKSGQPFPGGPPISHVFKAEGTQHVFYQGYDRHIHELWWRGGENPNMGDLTATAVGGAPSGGDPQSSYVFNADGTQHVFYVAEDHHIHELWWRGGQNPNPRDLHLLSGESLLPTGQLTSHVFDAEGTQHVFYVAAGDIIELAWRGDDEKPVPRNLTTTAVGGPAPSAAGPLISHVFNDEGTQHVFYTALSGHIHEFWWRSGEENPHLEDLTQQSSTQQSGPPPLAFGALASHVFDAEGTQHVFYVARAGGPHGAHIFELWWARGGGKHFEDLNDRSGNAPLVDLTGIDPTDRVTSHVTSHVFKDEGTQHVFYKSINGDIIELWSEM